MRRETGIFRRAVLFVLTFILAASYPFMAIADPQEPTSPSSETTTETQQTTTPETPQTSETSSSSTQETAKQPDKPKKPEKPVKPKITYTFNKETNKWESEQWVFNPLSNAYERPPKPIIIEPEVTDKSKAEIEKNIDTTVLLDTQLTSDAASGDALVFKNTTGGSATSGDAAAMANVLNVVNSTIGTSENQKIAQFTQDILGDVKGDIILSPLLLKAFLEAQAPDYMKQTVNADNTFGINNNLLLNATSGTAGVVGNTTGGNATSGNATAVANVVNVLNSMIAAQQSFIGTINIYGNLEGDILIAPDFIPQMIANNGGNEADLKLSSQETHNIVNNISAVAESGAASVFGNTNAGGATSGDAESNVVIFNLSGHEVIAKNSLLVFVNVLGKWVGVIVDAPEGATAAMLGNGVTKNSQANQGSYVPPDLTVNSQSSYGITNTVAVNAQSGDAVVANNTNAGNAISGTAKAMANIANVTGSQFSASDWFGVLFINVFQDWHGSFGIDTPYGNPIVNTPVPKAPVEFRPATNNRHQTTVRYRIIDSRTVAAVVAAVTNTTTEDGKTISESDTMAEFSAQSALGTSDSALPPVSQDDYRLWIIAGSMLIIGLSVIGLKRLFS